MKIILKPIGALLILTICLALALTFMQKAGPDTSSAREALVATGVVPLRVFRTLTSDTPPINLTREGQQDWAFWGIPAQVHSNLGSLAPVRKVVPRPDTDRIGELKTLGTGPLPSSAPVPTAFTWANGDGIARVLRVNDSLQVSGNGRGFEFQSPPSENPRLLRVYVGGRNTDVEFTAQVIGRATPESAAMTETRHPNGMFSRIYTVRYDATPRPVTVVYRILNVQASDGFIFLQAATLE